MTSGASGLNEKMKEALEADPGLINLVDNGLFFEEKQITPDMQCFPQDAAELAYYIEVSQSMFLGVDGDVCWCVNRR